jgi:hypothetical protein
MKATTPLKAIRAKCLDCSGGQPSEVRECPMPDCPLHTYRMGMDPNRKGIGGDIAKDALSSQKPLDQLAQA